MDLLSRIAQALKFWAPIFNPIKLRLELDRTQTDLQETQDLNARMAREKLEF